MRDLGGGKLLALRTEDPEVQKPDLFVFELDDALQAHDLRLQAFQGWTVLGREWGRRYHVMQHAYTLHKLVS